MVHINESNASEVSHNSNEGWHDVHELHDHDDADSEEWLGVQWMIAWDNMTVTVYTILGILENSFRFFCTKEKRSDPADIHDMYTDASCYGNK